MYLRVWDVFSLFSIHEGFVKRGIEEIVGNLRSLQQQILGLQRRVQEIEEQVLSVAFYFLSHGVMESCSSCAFRTKTCPLVGQTTCQICVQ